MLKIVFLPRQTFKPKSMKNSKTTEEVVKIIDKRIDAHITHAVNVKANRQSYCNYLAEMVGSIGYVACGTIEKIKACEVCLSELNATIGELRNLKDLITK